MALAVVAAACAIVASFSVIWLLDVVVPTDQHPAVVASRSVERVERQQRGRHYTSTTYHNVARDLDGALIAVGFSTTMGVALGFGTIGLWRRSPIRYRTPVLIVAATVGAGVGVWGFLIRENAVEGDVADAIEVPTDVVGFGSTASWPTGRSR